MNTPFTGQRLLGNHRLPKCKPHEVYSQQSLVYYESTAIAISDFWNSGLIYYFIPQQIKVRNAPDVKITATLIRPVPVGRSLTLGGTTDITCNSLNVTVQSPTGQTFTANSSGRSVGKSVTLTSAGLYTITVTAQKTASSTPVVYVYTVRAY